MSAKYLLGGATVDNLEGDGGDDTFTGNEGDDTLEGLAGDDTYIFNSGDGADTVKDDGGTLKFNNINNLNELTFEVVGDNVVIRSGTSDSVTIQSSENDGGFNFNIIDGSDDLLATISRLGSGVTPTINDDSNILFGTKGNVVDNIQGEGGNDILFGGDGGDTLDGGAGDDNIFGDDGGDILKGGDGRDTLEGGIGGDTLEGGKGDDTLVGGEDLDTYIFSSNDGLDTVKDDNGGILQFNNVDNPDAFSFETIVDRIPGSVDLKITIQTNDGGNDYSDSVTIIDYVDHMFNIQYGAAKIDLGKLSVISSGNLLTGENEKTALAVANIDGVTNGYSIQARGDDDTIYGGVGVDTLKGGAGADTIFGGGESDSIEGEDGVDTIFGGEDLDYIEGGPGNDILEGGDGNDIYTFYSGDGLDSIKKEDQGILRFRSVSSLDEITLNINSNEDIVINVGSDSVTLTDGSSNLQIEYGSPSTTWGTILVASGAGTLTGESGTDILFGSKGEVVDTLQGGAGDDLLFGRAGVDTLEGGAGADTLEGGLGDDILEGGADLDTYVYYYTNAIQHGKDTINEEGSELNNIKIILEDLPAGFDWTSEVSIVDGTAGRILLQFDTDNHISLLRSDIDDGGGKFELTFLHKDKLDEAGVKVSALDLKTQVDDNYYRIDFVKGTGSIYILKDDVENQNFKIEFINGAQTPITISQNELADAAPLDPDVFTFDLNGPIERDISIDEVESQQYVINIDALPGNIFSLADIVRQGSIAASFEEGSRLGTPFYEFTLSLSEKLDAGNENKLKITDADSQQNFIDRFGKATGSGLA